MAWIMLFLCVSPTDKGMKMDDKLKARSRLEIRAKPLRGWLFWGGWLVLGLSLMIFLMVGALIGTAGGMVYSGGSMAVGLVLVGTLLAMDAVIACGLFRMLQESKTRYLCDDAGIRQIRPFKRCTAVWSYIGDAEYVPNGLFTGEHIILFDQNNRELMRITHLSNLPGNGYPLVKVLRNKLNGFFPQTIDARVN